MPVEILMPALSPTMESGNLAKWHVKEGDTIEIGDVIAEIETDKATMEVEAVDEGVVGKIFVAEGTADVAVNTQIAALLVDGEDASAISDAPAATAAPVAQAAEAEAPAASAAVVTPAPAAGQKDGKRIFASPLARRIAEQKGLDLVAIAGSGPHGRIVKADVENATAAPKAAAAPAPKAAAPAASSSDDAQTLKLFNKDHYELVPHDGMRKTIARRLTESKQQVPHFYLSVDCQLDALLALRKQLNSGAPEVDGKPAYKISVNDMVIKAHALALNAVPEANASWTDDNMILHKHADVGVAVSIPGGLITPIIRAAETKTLSTISKEMKDLAKRARDRKLKPEEYQGGTSAVSNLGMFGVKEFSAIVNPPHGSILAVGTGRQVPSIVDGEVKASTVMTVTLSVDHRAVDGALGAQLLQAFQGFIENPMGMLV